MRATVLFWVAVPLLVFSLLVVACGDDDDDAAPSDTVSASDGSTGRPTTGVGPAATSEPASGAGDGESGEASGGEGVGTVTVGDETWTVIASKCETDPAASTVNIVGHAESDDSIEISLEFDPADIGLVLTVEGPDGDPSWAADNATFTTTVGGPFARGEGTFTSADSSTADGSFDLMC